MHTFITHAHSFSVSRLPLAARLTKGQFKAKCSRRCLNKPLESPRARGPLGKPSTPTQMRTHSHTHPSDRLTEVIESPFASESFHHRPDRPHHAAASRTDVCIDQTNRQQVVTSVCVCVREDENMLSAYERGRKKVYLRVCVCLRAVSINGRINGSISVKNATWTESWILLTPKETWIHKERTTSQHDRWVNRRQQINEKKKKLCDQTENVEKVMKVQRWQVQNLI